MNSSIVTLNPEIQIVNFTKFCSGDTNYKNDINNIKAKVAPEAGSVEPTCIFMPLLFFFICLLYILHESHNFLDWSVLGSHINWDRRHTIQVYTCPKKVNTEFLKHFKMRYFFVYKVWEVLLHFSCSYSLTHWGE